MARGYDACTDSADSYDFDLTLCPFGLSAPNDVEVRFPHALGASAVSHRVLVEFRIVPAILLARSVPVPSLYPRKSLCWLEGAFLCLIAVLSRFAGVSTCSTSRHCLSELQKPCNTLVSCFPRFSIGREGLSPPSPTRRSTWTNAGALGQSSVSWSVAFVLAITCAQVNHRSLRRSVASFGGRGTL